MESNGSDAQKLFIAAAVFAREKMLNTALVLACDQSNEYMEVAEVYDALFQAVNEVEGELRLGIQPKPDKMD